MEDLLLAIAQSDEDAVEELLRAVRKRYAVLFPDWELSMISVKKNADKNEQLDKFIALLQNLKTDGEFSTGLAEEIQVI